MNSLKSHKIKKLAHYLAGITANDMAENIFRFSHRLQGRKESLFAKNSFSIVFVVIVALHNKKSRQIGGILLDENNFE